MKARLLRLALLGLVALTTQAQPSTPSLTDTPSVLQRLETGKPVEHVMVGGEIHRYSLPLRHGQYLYATINQQQIGLLVRVIAPNGDTLTTIDSYLPDVPVTLEAKTVGSYRIEVFPYEKEPKPGRYQIRVNEVLSAQAYAKRLAQTFRQQKAVIGWSKANAIPLKTVEVGNGFADLQPLKKLFHGVRFVGLGEATHGTREFFQMKHRLLEFLVLQMGFRLFAIEASYSALQTINEFVMGRPIDGPQALERQGLWNWNTQEVLALMNWARHYNAGVTADKRVKFCGLDIQYNQAGKDKLLAYLRQVAPERFSATKAFSQTDLDSLSSRRGVSPTQLTENLQKLKALNGNYNELLVFLEINGASLSAQSSQAQYEQMREFARVLVQYTDCFSHPNLAVSRQTRDRYMATNFRRLMSRQPPGTRAVIWAHNDHLTKDANGWTDLPLGVHLRRFYGHAYYALGLTLNQGTFQAREARPKDATRPMVMAYTLKPAPEGSADWLLTQTGLKKFLLDFRSSPQSADIRSWLASPHLMRSRGSTFEAALEPMSFLPYTPSKHYDGLLFVEHTTRARPNPSVKYVAVGDGN